MISYNTILFAESRIIHPCESSNISITGSITDALYIMYRPQQEDVDNICLNCTCEVYTENLGYIAIYAIDIRANCTNDTLDLITFYTDDTSTSVGCSTILYGLEHPLISYTGSISVHFESMDTELVKMIWMQVTGKLLAPVSN